MSDFSSTVASPNPFESLQTSIEARRLELDFLLEHFGPALELVSDHSRLNGIIEASPRPDLVLTDPAEQMQIDYPYSPGKINNFTPGMRAFGPRVYKEGENWQTGEPELKLHGRRPPSRQELDRYFFLGARGEYKEHKAFCKANDVDEDTAQDTLLQNHANKEAFMRMWIALPTLTEHLMAKCLDDRSKPSSQYYEEIFVAYSVMSQLVDKNDKCVKRVDIEQENNSGTYIDNWLLCR
jgi:hypothetical protein